MVKNKAIFAIGATFLFLAVAMIPASASINCQKNLCNREYVLVTETLDELMNKIEGAESYEEVLEIIRDFCENDAFGNFPIIKEILLKILKWVISQRSLYFGGYELGRILNKGLFGDRSSEKFIVSFGSYNNILPGKKDEKITLFKQGFAFWHYSGKAKLSQGRTMIIERQPFNIKQQLSGAQFGFMTGFKGLYLDVESKLTGNSYVFIMGNARRARAFGLSLFSD